MSDHEPQESSSTESAPARHRIGGPLALTAVTLGLLTWPIAFNLGAYGEIFYDDIFRVVVASSILFAITIANSPYPSPWNWVVPITLAAPLVWFLTAAWVEGSTSAALDRPVFVVWIVLILVVSVPVTLRLLIDLFLPELSRAGSRRILATVVGLVVTVGLVGFVVGRENDRFMTCSDFAVAGSAEPDNCVTSPD